MLLDPDDLRPNSVIDLGMLGVSDRHRDLALVTRSMSAPHINRGYSPHEAAQLLDLAVGPVEPGAVGLVPAPR